MANVIKPKRSNTAAKVPNTSELLSGELGVNMADRKVYINNGTSVVQVGAGVLSALGDVVLTSPSNGQTLSYNGTNWVNAAAGAGTVTSVTGTSPIASSGGSTPAISLSANYGDTLNPYASKTANTFLAAPNGSAGVPSFRAVVAADIPTLNQNTTGSAATFTSTAQNSQFNSVGVGAAASAVAGRINSTTAIITPNTSGVSTGLNVVNGDITTYRTGGTTGVIYLSNSGTKYLYYDGTNYNMPGGAIISNNITAAGNVTGTATNVTGTVVIANGGTGATTNTAARTNLGATTVGSNFFTLTNPSAITFPRMNADNTVSSLDAATFRTAIGAGTGSGTVTSVTGTAPVVSSGGATPAISMAAATTSVNGYLTSTDWNTFNGKQAALGFTPYNATNPSNYIALASAITGYTVGTNTALAATDTLLAGLGKIQGQINARSGTVTSVGGTGTVSGLTLTGTVTTTGNLTLGGNLSITADMIYQSFTATASQTTFTPTTAYTSGKIDVFANGIKMVNGSDVTVTSGTSVVFATGVAVNTRVDLVYPI